MSTYSDQINVVINERLLPKMQNLSMQIANIEPYSYSSTELEDYKRQLDYYSMIYDFLNEYALGTEELDNAKLVNIVRLVDAPSQERKSSNYLSTSISKALKAKTGYKLYLNKTEITPDTIRRAKESPIQDYFGTGKFRRCGNRLVGVCPLPGHIEKTGSFVIYLDQNTFHCYGCQANSDVISFIQKTQNLTFIQAVRFLLHL